MFRRALIALALGLGLTSSSGFAQMSEAFGTLDSAVGFIDTAIPWNRLRIRYDAGYDLQRPDRAEFFYAKNAPFKTQLPNIERKVDYHELTAVGELLVTDRISLFAEMPFRFLTIPLLGFSSSGLSDITFGAKFAFLNDTDFYAAFQTRVFTPSGNGQQGLGTDHVTIEPGVLTWYRPDELLTIEGEFRTWIPIDGSDFAGTAIRYGIGASLHAWSGMTKWFRPVPVVELIGWTALNGKEGLLNMNGADIIRSAAGNTILNISVGSRFLIGSQMDLYIGYSRPLSGDRWYNHLLRLELRQTF